MTYNQKISKKTPGFLKGYGNTRLFWLRLGAVFLTAVLQPTLSAPLNWWPVHWISWIPFLWAIHSQEGKGKFHQYPHVHIHYTGFPALQLPEFDVDRPGLGNSKN